MRKLLLFFAMLSVSIGAWAGPAEGFEMKQDQIGNWSKLNPAEKVIYVEVLKQGGLKNALDELTLILSGDESKPHYANYRNALGADNITNKNLMLKVVYNPANGEPAEFSPSTADLAALAAIDIPTIDLQDLKPAAAFTFANANVKRIILPDGWDKTAVRNAAQAIPASNSNFESCLSQTPAQSGADGGVVAYVKKPGTLYTAMHHTYYDGHDSQKIGQASQYYTTFNKLATISIMGYPSARDFNGSAYGACKFDENGHFVFDVPADETSTATNAGVGGVTRQLTGTALDGALAGAQPIVLDLEDAIIYDQWNEDLNLSWSYLLGESRIKRVIIPTTPELKTIPADFLNAGGNVNYIDEICIPGNIEIIRTRAFYSSQQMLKHVWTTGTTDHMVYDNGAYLRSNRDQLDEDGNFNVDHYGYADLNSEVWNCGKSAQDAPRYGTITLPENLKLIESNCFSCRSVSDVYVLAKVAPECHVDAFSSIMYMGNNTIDPNGAASGMITRWSYAQGDATAEYITFLHYPRECGTPEIQRYTDPTREYSVATTWRDGKGNIVYFPNQSELNRAYYQGTTGYVWYAWDSERIPDNGNNGDANAFKNVNINGNPGHSDANQQMGNNYYINNEMTDPDKTDRSFYDVRLGANGQVKWDQPEGLDWYYNTVWEETQLYPEATETKKNDYRGWHQFILNAYATNDDRPITPVKFYQTDSDWWTVCLPYDLKYSDMIRFFGDGEGKKPYLSKLRYVVRDYDKGKITLMFSKNLMEYKEVITNPSITDDYVHGLIDDETTYTDIELADDPIILHKGVPYLIKPNIPTNANRSFDVYKRDHENANPDLYQRLVDAQNVPAAQLETYIYKGEYTVPAYVIGDNAPEATQETRDFEHALGPTFSYSSSDQITYGGKKVSAKISSEFSYTFVGSYFLSILPQNCYFLGWDSKKQCAAFWYNRVSNPASYDWNNQTGVICANFDTDTMIDPATGLNDPAKWYIPAVANDDLTSNTTGNAKSYGMDFGGSVDVVVSGIGKITVDNAQNKVQNNDVIFDMRGVRMNRPLSRLTKGVYIVNGKKYVVD